MRQLTAVFALSLLSTGFVACDSGDSGDENIDYNAYVYGAGGKGDSLFPAPAVCSFEKPWVAENSKDLEDEIDRTRRYTAKSRLRETQVRQIYLANMHLDFLSGTEPFDAVWENTDDDDYAIHRVEIEGGKYDWVKFYAGDTEIGVVYKANTLDIVAEISDGDLLSCESSDPEANTVSPNLDATLFVQVSAEYKANAKMAYKMAGMQLDQAIADETWTAAEEQQPGFEQLPPAIILDLDETVVDNSPFQARLMVDNVSYHSSRWSKWVNESNASAVPGSVEFLRAAHAKGVTIFYVSNRSASLEEATRENLKKLDLPMETNIDTVLLKKEETGWGSDKTPRRERVAETHRIIMLFGDNLGDFVGGAKSSTEERNALEAQNEANWGSKWFMIANPMYGYWEGALYNHELGVGDGLKALIKKESLNTKRD